MSNGQPWWRYTKHGREEQNTVMCFKCQWFQPMYQEEDSQLKKMRAKGVVIPEGASPEGYCRKKSVPITNYNAPMVLPTFPTLYSQVLSNDQSLPPTQSLQEVFQVKGQEYWCRYWVRTATPFLWPPTYGS